MREEILNPALKRQVLMSTFKGAFLYESAIIIFRWWLPGSRDRAAATPKSNVNVLRIATPSRLSPRQGSREGCSCKPS